MTGAAVPSPKHRKLPIVFILASVVPTLILTVLFIIIPTLRALWLSFTDATSLGLNSRFVAFENYAYMLRDRYFILALVNTAKLMAVVPAVTIALGVGLAYMISQSKLKERGLYRAILYFPNIVSLTVVGIIWSFVFHPNLGIINTTLRAIGLEGLARPWLGDSRTALWCIAVTPRAIIWSCTLPPWTAYPRKSMKRRKSTGPERGGG